MAKSIRAKCKRKARSEFRETIGNVRELNEKSMMYFIVVPYVHTHTHTGYSLAYLSFAVAFVII